MLQGQYAVYLEEISLMLSLNFFHYYNSCTCIIKTQQAYIYPLDTSLRDLSIKGKDIGLCVYNYYTILNVCKMIFFVFDQYFSLLIRNRVLNVVMLLLFFSILYLRREDCCNSVQWH